ncbi:hypothetical protein JOE63_002494 [Cellulosimicrobium cellulans]|uniref:hypothetical protein n=1 Tax=Cellulosimicrobium cellulans TaxID=1710 RepID=UPI0019571903|nr:hypothetical protein [Cellulosimicrobium cellulans]MBM7820017.1 hypothetical protein [Cellulosimicrobium cellulans]
MSFDVFLQRFVDGEAAGCDAGALLAVLDAYVTRDVRTGEMTRAVFDDGDAEIFGADLSRGLMLSHIAGLAAWDVVTDLARAGSLAILAVGCPAAVPSETLLPHLPVELRDGAVVVARGSELREALGIR